MKKLFLLLLISFSAHAENISLYFEEIPVRDLVRMIYGEILNRPFVPWRDVDMSIPAIIITSSNSKNGKRRIIPLNQTAQLAISELHEYRRKHAPESPWVFTKRNGERLKCLDNAFNRACKRANIQDFRIHDLRHTFASDLVKAGVSLYHVKTLLGHSSIKQTERYAHLATDALAEAVTVLDKAK